MKFYIYFNLLGLEWPFDIEFITRNNDLVAIAIKDSGGRKLQAVKNLRMLFEEYDGTYLGLREAKDIIDKAW